MFDTGSPRTVSEIDERLGALVAAGREHVAGIAAPAFFAPRGAPGAEKWSPAEVVRHLTKSTRPVALALRAPKLALWGLYGRSNGVPSRGFDELVATYRAALAAGGKAGRFAPSPKPVPPDAEAARAEIVAGWAGAAEDLRAAARAWDEADLDDYRLPHPLIGKLTMREMLMFTVYHTAHHLRQLD